jgi:polysaccharide deacetylase family protein (PEP-CTERM system associated)
MNILTFDVEEWFHILDNKSTKMEADWVNYECRIHKNMDRILAFLDKHNQKATFFCLGWVAKEFPEIIKTIHSLGHEIACHSNLHQLTYEQSTEEFETDLNTALGLLEDLIGEKIRAYRAPGFSVTNNNTWVFEKLIQAGIEIDCSIFPASRAHGGFKEFRKEGPTIIEYGPDKIKEFPINTTLFLGKRIIYTGGGYFRLFPYWFIHRVARKSSYIMTYFHPRDFDTSQPLISGLSAIRKFKSYYGLNTCQDKLEKFIDDINFITLREADQSINWNSVPRVTL